MSCIIALIIVLKQFYWLIMTGYWAMQNRSMRGYYFFKGAIGSTSKKKSMCECHLPFISFSPLTTVTGAFIGRNAAARLYLAGKGREKRNEGEPHLNVLYVCSMKLPKLFLLNYSWSYWIPLVKLITNLLSLLELSW